MNRTIRNLVIAVPLATVGLTMVNVTAATAGPNGPDIIVIKPKGGDPLPPKPPKNLDLPLKDAPKPQDPKPAPKPQGGNQVVAPAAPKADTKTTKTVEVVSAHGSADSIDRTDALFVAGPAETTLATDTTDNGIDLTWLLLGGGIVTASGIAFAARKRTNA